MGASRTYISDETVERIINDAGALVNIGQISPAQQRMLERHVRRGSLVKYRGYWDTMSPHYGIGPLKTIYAKAA
jgi:hypothetical protein